MFNHCFNIFLNIMDNLCLNLAFNQPFSRIFIYSLNRINITPNFRAILTSATALENEEFRFVMKSWAPGVIEKGNYLGQGDGSPIRPIYALVHPMAEN